MSFWKSLYTFTASSSSSSSISKGARRRSKRTFEQLEGRALLSATSGDFNGDGFLDLAVGMPHDKVGSADQAGSVQVIYGSVDGLTAIGRRSWTKDTAGIRGVAQAGDQFGAVVVSGDFNRDGFDDLAIGAPGSRVDGQANAGAVHILYGSAKGLQASGNQVWVENSPRIGGTPQAGDKFGSSLAVADFNRDGYDDLVIGTPGDRVSGQANAGSVHILFGRNSGLSSVKHEFWHQNRSGIQGTAASGDLFGTALAIGDFNADGFQDLAIGTPGEAVSGKAGAGGVNVIYGSSVGLRTNGNQMWTLDSAGVQGVARANVGFGTSLASGNFNDDSYFDLAIGSPGERVGNVNEAGAVHVLYGRRGGLSGAADQVWTESSSGISNSPQAGDRFGSVLYADRMNNDRTDDLIIGTPRKNVGTTTELREGMVRILYGNSSNGLVTSGTQLLHQNSGNTPGVAAADDQFGSCIAIGDFNRDGRNDLAVGVIHEPGSRDLKGAVNVFYGNNSGANTSNNMQLWTRRPSGVLNSLEEQNRREGREFLAANKNKPGVISTSSGLQYKVLRSGNGAVPNSNSTVRTHYHGTLIDGTVFDTTRDNNQPATFSVGGVIDGWQEALQLMHVGDKWQLFIPSELAYGERGSGSTIGPNAVLIFEIELLAIV